MIQDDEPIRVLVITDSDGQMLRQAVERAPDLLLAGEFASIEAAVEQAGSDGAAVVVVRIMDDEKGAEQVQQLRSAFPSTHVIAVSASTDPQFAERLLRAGALGYLTKPSAAHEIADAVRSVSREKAYVNRRVARKILRLLMQKDHSDPHSSLTNREREVLELIGRKGVDEIADGLGLTARTVESYCRSIRDKLGLASFSELVDHARRWQPERA